MPPFLKGIPPAKKMADGASKEELRALLNSDEYVRLEISRMPLGHIVWDKDFRVVSWNPAAEKIFGFSFEEARGRHPYELIVPPEAQPLVDEVWSRLLAGDSSAHSENENTTKGGRVIICDWNNTPLKQPDGTVLGVMSMVQDITERKRAEEELVQKNRTLRILSAVNQVLVHTPEEASLLHKVCEIVVETGGYRLAWIGFAEDDEEKSVRPAAYVGFESGYLESLKLVWADTERGRGPSGIAIRTGKPSVARNIATDPMMAPWREDALKRGYQSSIALPLMAGGKAIGMIGIYSSEPDAFSDEEILTLRELTDDLAFGVTTLRANSEHKTLEERFRAIFDNALDGILLADIETKKFLTGNKTICGMLGYTEEELKEVGVMDIHPEDDLPYVLDQFEKQTRGEILPAKNIPVKRKDGSVFYVEIKSSLVELGGKKYLLGIFRDITERREWEQTLRESAEELKKFKMAVEAASDQIILTDRAGVVIYVNKGVENFTGYSRKEIIGQKSSLWGGQMPKEFYAEMWKTIQDDKKPFSAEVTNRRKDGELYDAELHISPVLDDAGEVQYFIGVERDITKAKEMERAKDEFVSLASHQLRTPITTINWYLELLLEGDAGSLNEKQGEYFKTVYAASQQMNEILKAFLYVLRLEIGEVRMHAQETNLAEVARKELEGSGLGTQKKDIRVVEHYQDSLPPIRIDPELVKIVFQNLVSNAIKYTPDGGEVRISCGFEKRGGEVAGRTVDQDSVLTTVQDTGIGIPPEAAEKIFTRFFRAENAKQLDPNGNGLGLYIVKKMLDIAGGSIWFSSEEGKGTTFYVLLPIDGESRDTMIV